MSTSITQRVLVLVGPNSPNSFLVEQLRANFNLVITENIDEALAELSKGRFDAVFSDLHGFLPLKLAIAARESSLILDTIGEGICIIDNTAQLVWANRRMNQWSQEVQKRISQVCGEALQIFSHQASHAGSTEQLHTRSKKFFINLDDAQYFELICSPMLDAQMQVTQVVAICWDATGGRRLQQKIDAIDQAGRELVRLEGEAIAKLNVGQRLKLLEEKIIKYCRQLMQFDHFAIRLLDRRSNKLELVICVGLPREAMDVELFCEPEGNGISGHVASSGRSYICGDVSKDPRYVVGLNHAKSSLTVPLMLHDKVIGVFNIESLNFAGFTEDDRQFAEIFGRYVAIALNILDLLVVERYTTSGQLANDFTNEMAAPLNDIVSDATMLMDEYIGNEEMRKRLRSVLENVQKIRQCVKDVTDGPKSILGMPTATPRIDPVLEGKRLLVADDEPSIRQTLGDVLTRYGARVDLARDGAEACALIASQSPYDLVLSDIKMPHKNGYEIFAAACKLGHHPPVILMTGFGYDPSHSIVRSSQEGLAAVLFKPFKVDQLIAEIHKALEKKASAC